MERQQQRERGVTLIELLVVIGILGVILGGIYGLLTSAFRTYNHTRAKLESQQTARIVLDYLAYRLREVEGGAYTTQPWNCTRCHTDNMDQAFANDSSMPCVNDVTIPQKLPMILAHSTDHFSQLPGIRPEFQNMTGNNIVFLADLLPLNGFSESFTDSPVNVPNGPQRNDRWDWIKDNPNFDRNSNDRYDRGEPELLEDLNSNNNFDYFAERWTFRLRKSNNGPYYELIESVNFTSLHPRKRKTNGKLIYDNSVYDVTTFDGYTNIPVAYGITGLRIEKVPRLLNIGPTGNRVDPSCSQTGDVTACHGSGNTATGTMFNRSLNVYGNSNAFDYARFIATHPWWNIAGLSVEVVTTGTRGGNQQFIRLREFVNFRSLEINQ